MEEEENAGTNIELPPLGKIVILFILIKLTISWKMQKTLYFKHF